MRGLIVTAVMFALALVGGEARGEPNCAPYQVAARQLAQKYKEHLVQVGAWQAGARIER